MRLVYYTGNNFGDKLNPIILNHYLPSFFDDKEDSVFIGIGTIFGYQDYYKHATKKYIFSSGCGYGNPAKIDNSFNFLCVRGPLTARSLRLDKSYAITDGGILIKRVLNNEQPDNGKEGRPAYMPHWSSELKYDWKKICESLNINYLSPTEEVSTLIDKIRSSKYVITEAMHGAIVADTYRVPWVPVKIYNSFNHFKWDDWTQSMGINYKVITLPELYSNRERFVNQLKDKSGNFIGDMLGGVVFDVYDKFTNTQKRIDKVHYLLSDIIKSEPLHLSNENVLESKLNQLEEKLHAFYIDHKK